VGEGDVDGFGEGVFDGVGDREGEGRAVSEGEADGRTGGGTTLAGWLTVGDGLGEAEVGAAAGLAVVTLVIVKVKLLAVES